MLARIDHKGDSVKVYRTFLDLADNQLDPIGGNWRRRRIAVTVADNMRMVKPLKRIERHLLDIRNQLDLAVIAASPLHSPSFFARRANPLHLLQDTRRDGRLQTSDGKRQNAVFTIAGILQVEHRSVCL